MKTHLKILFIICFFGLTAVGCQYDFNIQPQNHSNIILFDKPLPIIQQNITGTRNLQYKAGGFAYRKYVDTLNTFWNLSPNHILAYNDISGAYINANIIWIPKRIYNEKTYLLSYQGSSIYYIMNQIKNDTLIIREYVDDGYTYYFTKVKPL